MTTDDQFGRTLSTWLHEEAEHRMPDHLNEVLVATVATRQRRWWSSPERWLPMDTLAVPRSANLRPILILTIIGLLIAALGVAVVASQGPTVPPGLAANGRIFVVEGSRLTSYAADGADPQVVADVPGGSTGLSFAPDGRRLAFFTEASPQLVVMTIPDGDAVTVPLGDVEGIGGPLHWSPDGSRLLFNTWDGTAEHLITVAADGGDVREVDLGDLGAPASAGAGHRELWPAGWSPRGDRIAFVVVEPGDLQGSIAVSRPDGTELQRFRELSVEPHSVSWSPDPTTERLVAAVPQRAGDIVVSLVDPVTGFTDPIGPGFWPSWSPDGRRIAYWDAGTVVVDVEGAVAGTAQPARVFETPAHTQAGKAPLPGRYTSCENPEALLGNEICRPVGWSPDGEWVYGPDINGHALIMARADGNGTSILVEVTSGDDYGYAWQPVP